jgi:predicted Fe-S protein YdhL (DUF1289 family)
VCAGCGRLPHRIPDWAKAPETLNNHKKIAPFGRSFQRRPAHDRHHPAPQRPDEEPAPLLSARNVEPDLFGAWCFIREWGRIGRSGQVREVPCPTLAEAQAVLDRQRRRKERKGYADALKALV